MGALDLLRPRKAAVRTPPASDPAPTATPALGQSTPKATPFDPTAIGPNRFSDLITDPVYWALNNTWRDRQQHGRIQYEAMARHPDVAAALGLTLAFLTATKPHFRPRARDPTPKQKEIADFANHILSRLDWPAFVDGPQGQKLQFGFSLTEIESTVDLYRGKPHIVLKRLRPLPQASLDNGFVPREELGQLSLSLDPRYRCFEFEPKGDITAVRQFQFSSTGLVSKEANVWRGPELDSILHFKHRGGDGNPWGESLLYSAFYAWRSLYVLEAQEEAFLDGAAPWLFGTYKSLDGTSRPGLHNEVEDHLEQQEVYGGKRFIMWADGDLKSVAPGNENFTAHATLKKKELRDGIWRSLLLPKSLVAETESTDGDTRNLAQVFLKYTLKARFAEVGRDVEDLVHRFIRANYPRGLSAEDLPEARFSIVTENEVRVAQGLLPQILPHLSVEKAPSVLHRIFGFLDADDFPTDPNERIAVKWPAPEPPAQPGDPPPKEDGQDRVRQDGQTENPSGRPGGA